MKRSNFLILAFILSLPLISYAAIIGSPDTQGKFKLGVGLDTEYVFDRKFQQKNINDPTFAIRAKYAVDRSSQAMAKVSFGLLEGLDIYVKAGTVNPTYKIGHILDIGGGTSASISGKLNSSNNLIYGGGFKGKLEFAGWIFGCDGQYLRYKTKYSTSDVRIVAPPVLDIPLNWTGTTEFYEWHAAPYISKRIGSFLPYVGGRYSYSNLHDKPRGLAYPLPFAIPSGNYKGKYNWGAFAGLNCKFGKNFSLNLEGSYRDETAASLGLNYTF